MKNIKFSPPDITEKEIQAVSEVLRSGWITTGPKTKLFEQRISEYCGTLKTACLNSATACLELILRILGVKKGDEVITSAYTYSASCSVICHVGATPILIDVNKDSFEMNYNLLEKAINKRTKVIIPVDIAGVPCDYEKIYNIINLKKNIFMPESELQEKFKRIVILADSAHSFGAKRNGISTGNLADFTVFSFHAVKNLTTGEGGAVTWKKFKNIDNNKIYKKIMLYSLHGQDKDALEKTQMNSWEYDIKFPGYKCNMTDIMAAIGLVQLERYNKILKRRHEIIEKYNKFLEKMPVTFLSHVNENYFSSGHLYLINLKNKNENFRNKLIERMAENGINTNVHYKPLPMHTAYKDLNFNIKNFPNSYNLYKNEITLPLYSLLTDEDIDYILKNFYNIFNELEKSKENQLGYKN